MKRSAIFFGGAILLAACQERPAPGPVAASGASESQDAAALLDAGPRAVEITNVLGDPRFFEAKQLHDAHDFRAEGAALLTALTRAESPDRAQFTADEKCVVAYAAGRAFVQADDSGNAIRAFDLASADGCKLAPYAKVRGAQARARSSGADEALARLTDVDAPVMQDEKNLVIADCKWEKAAREEAVPLMRAWLKNNPHGQRWVDVSLKIAAFDLQNHVEGDELGKEAFDLATRVLTEAPRLEADAAKDLRARAALALKRPAPLTPEERARRARGFLDTGDNESAIFQARDVVSDPRSRPEDACRAAIVNANAEHGKPAIYDAWTQAIKRCEKMEAQGDELVGALYNGAKAAASAKHDKEAIDTFARVEDKYPAHRLADDARFRAANVYKSMGDIAKYESMLMSIVEAYPAGDMADEGLFLVALMHLGKSDDAGATPPLDKINEREKGLNRSWATGGRAAYFRARIAERAGDKDDAKRRYADVITSVPLGYYAWLAHARLAALDPALAATTQHDAEEKDEKDAAASPAEKDALLLARRFLAVGEIELAKRALSLGGVGGAEAPIDEKVQVARIFDDARKWDDGIAFSRGKTSEIYAHYPAGKWRAGWEAAYPRAFEDEVVRMSGQNAVPATLTWAIMREESSFMPEVKSPANAYGLMQLIVPTAKLVAQGTNLSTDEASLKRADVSIALGTKLLAHLRSSLTHPLFAIAAYNGGAGAVKKWLGDFATTDLDLFVEMIPWDETRGYVKRVTMSEMVYAYLYDKKGYDDLTAMSLVITR